MSPTGPRRVVVVTGGATGIGAGIAEALGRAGAFVVTLDANVSLDGSSSAEADGPTTAERIVAAGGAARPVDLSVTDRPHVERLFADLVTEHGSLDAVVNVAGISRPTAFGRGSEDDWRAVIQVHLEGYLTVLGAALPIMATAGHGRIVGVTSGSGWRPANAGAYAAAKRAVAALTWQLGRAAPAGVTVNALSPIAATRMVTAGLRRAGGDSSARSGGIELTGFPPPEALGPVGAHLAGEQFSWCRGQVLFSAGAELALIAEPRVVEAVRTRPAASLATTLDTVVPEALVPAEAAQATGGGSTARFADAFDRTDAPIVAETHPTCLVVAESPAIEAELADALRARGATCTTDTSIGAPHSPFDDAATRVTAASDRLGRLDAVVLAVGARDTPSGATDHPAIGATEAETPGAPSWDHVLADHRGLPDQILEDAAWMAAVSVHTRTVEAPCRLVLLVDAVGPGGRSRAQAATQLARAALDATDDRVAAFVISCESARADDRHAAAELAAVLASGDGMAPLSGAELCVGDGWLGLRSHPVPAGTVNFGGPDVPDWVDSALRSMTGAG